MREDICEKLHHVLQLFWLLWIEYRHNYQLGEMRGAAIIEVYWRTRDDKEEMWIGLLHELEMCCTCCRETINQNDLINQGRKKFDPKSAITHLGNICCPALLKAIYFMRHRERCEQETRDEDRAHETYHKMSVVINLQIASSGRDHYQPCIIRTWWTIIFWYRIWYKLDWSWWY